MAKKKKEIELVIEDGGEMSEADVESIAKMLFEWWKREFEEREKSEDGTVTEKIDSD
jgi:predicted CopG family antitoxin